MPKYSCVTLVTSSLFAVFSAGCAHPQTVPTLTSAATVAPPTTPAPAAPPAPAPVAAEATPAGDAPKADDAKPARKPGEPMTFAELNAALGSDDKLGLDLQRTTEAPAGKGLSADGYSVASVAHQAADVSGSSHLGGDIKVSGGLTAAAIRTGVHTEASRLRACYEHGLSVNPHLAGTVTVRFSVDDHGAVSDVETESDAIPADVTTCIQAAFNAMTFAPAKNPPAKVVYPIDFNKDS